MAGFSDTPPTALQPKRKILLVRLYTKNAQLSREIVLAQVAQQLPHGGVFGIRPVSYTLVIVNGKSTSYLFPVWNIRNFRRLGRAEGEIAE